VTIGPKYPRRIERILTVYYAALFKEVRAMMWYGWDSWGWGGWIMMTVVMVVFWAAVITAIVLVVRYVAGDRGSQPRPGTWGSSSAEDVLAERFARGEIDEDEYRRRIALLHEHR
jgi:putative membrane protein